MRGEGVLERRLGLRRLGGEAGEREGEKDRGRRMGLHAILSGLGPNARDDVTD